MIVPFESKSSRPDYDTLSSHPPGFSEPSSQRNSTFSWVISFQNEDVSSDGGASTTKALKATEKEEDEKEAAADEDSSDEEEEEEEEAQPQIEVCCILYSRSLWY